MWTLLLQIYYSVRPLVAGAPGALAAAACARISGIGRASCDSCFQDSLFVGEPLFVGWQTIHILIKSDEKHKLMHLRAHQLCIKFSDKAHTVAESRHDLRWRWSISRFVKCLATGWPRGVHCRSGMAMAVLVRTLRCPYERNQAISRHFPVREAASCRASILAYSHHLLS